MDEQIVEALPTPPIEYAGKWIVYNTGRTEIIASGNSFEEAYEAAEAAGEKDPLFNKVPRGILYVDGRFR